MANTTNFNWETPDDTDLVKDGAAAIRTLGSAIDTSLVDLKGGTTGQVLSKATNTDMDFTWVAQDDSNAIQNAIIDAKGDLIVGASSDTPARLAVGTNGHILTADSTATNGIKWAAPAGGGSGLTLVKTETFGSAITSLTITNVFSSTYDNYLILISGGVASANCDINLQLGSTTTGYYAAGFYMYANNGAYNGASYQNQPVFYGIATASANSISGSALIIAPNLAKRTQVQIQASKADTADSIATWYEGFENSNTQYTDITIKVGASANITGGTVKIYGYANS
jgi:hypothetical protein